MSNNASHQRAQPPNYRGESGIGSSDYSAGVTSPALNRQSECHQDSLNCANLNERAHKGSVNQMNQF